MIWNIIFYGIIIAVGLTVIAVTIYRIDWARHPEKYKKDFEEFEKEEYWKKKNAEKAAAAQKQQNKAKELRKAERVEKLNAIRAKNGKGPDANKNKKK